VQLHLSVYNIKFKDIVMSMKKWYNESIVQKYVNHYFIDLIKAYHA